ncbi:MAG TPA: FAD-binding oxidoreductase [Gemmatimonadales bacterium]|nr:FAD-binding oxidoreductase [Gemmatimonadales bacterium]
MAGASLSLLRRVRAMVGPDAVVDTDAAGTPRVAPRSEEACALVLETAASEGWRVSLAGAHTWVTGEAAADLVLSTTGLSRIVAVAPGDLVATVEAGVLWDDLRRALADAGAWAAIDPPGIGRTTGSIIATATAGPLRTGLGGVREQVLGLTLVTGEGKIVRVGGRVVKNVAGFDLAKLATGSFGAFGLITTIHLRLRAVPRADRTFLFSADRDRTVHAALAVLDSGLVPAALEVLSPAAAGRPLWTLAVRLLGSFEAVEATHRSVAGAVEQAMEELGAERARAFWARLASGCIQSPVTLRVGTLATALDDTLDLVAHHLDDTWIAASPGAGGLRWSGSAPLDRLRLFRHAAAQREMPVTLERAPADLRDQLGIFGAYREGIAPLVGSLRQSFDPAGVLAVPLSAAA